ncbi:MAG: hypothetical protein U0R51_14710 [Solirubrobacterales bacterium]
MIVTLGNFATKLITGDQTGITKVRGRPQTHQLGERTVRVFPILHPAAALRTPRLQGTMSEDFAAMTGSSRSRRRIGRIRRIAAAQSAGARRARRR